jgi:protein SCO1/2
MAPDPRTAQPVVGPVDEDETLRIPRWLKAVAASFFTLALAAVAFAVFEPIQVLPRIRLAPGYGLVADDGSVATSEDARGQVTLYSFAPTDCGDRCDAMFDTLATVQDRIGREVDLGSTEFKLVTIAIDGVEDPGALSEAARASGADGVNWRWYGGDEDAIETVVARGFRRWFERDTDGELAFDPAFVLVDGNGLIRGDYRYQTLAADHDKFVRHAEILAEEIRYADGPTALAYEAAHLFLCYP